MGTKLAPVIEVDASDPLYERRTYWPPRSRCAKSGYTVFGFDPRDFIGSDGKAPPWEQLHNGRCLHFNLWYAPIRTVIYQGMQTLILEREEKRRPKVYKEVMAWDLRPTTAKDTLAVVPDDEAIAKLVKCNDTMQLHQWCVNEWRAEMRARINARILELPRPVIPEVSLRPGERNVLANTIRAHQRYMGIYDPGRIVGVSDDGDDD